MLLCFSLKSGLLLQLKNFLLSNGFHSSYFSSLCLFSLLTSPILIFESNLLCLSSFSLYSSLFFLKSHSGGLFLGSNSFGFSFSCMSLCLKPSLFNGCKSLSFKSRCLDYSSLLFGDSLSLKFILFFTSSFKCFNPLSFFSGCFNPLSFPRGCFSLSFLRGCSLFGSYSLCSKTCILLSLYLLSLDLLLKLLLSYSFLLGFLSLFLSGFNKNIRLLWC